MRYAPEIIPPEKIAAQQKKVQEITRKLASCIAIVSVFIFFIKLIFL
jgi:hypothetical protein